MSNDGCGVIMAGSIQKCRKTMETFHHNMRNIYCEIDCIGHQKRQKIELKLIANDEIPNCILNVKHG